MSNKSFSAQVKSVDADGRKITAVASTTSVDRDGEIIAAGAFNTSSFMGNPVIIAGHTYSSPDGSPTVIGKATALTTHDGGMDFEMEFADTPLADQYWSLYRDGFMRAFSVGFIAQEWRDADRDEKSAGASRVCTSAELLEISAVSVPSNRDALVQARSKGYTVPDELLAEVKAGRTLSAKNEAALREAVAGIETATAALRKVLAAVEVSTDSADAEAIKIETDEAARKMADAYLGKQAQAEKHSAKQPDDADAALAKALAELNAKLKGGN